MERKGNGASSEDKAEYLLQRVLEYRQGQLEARFEALYAEIHGKEGLLHQHLQLKEETRHRHAALMCAARYIGGIVAAMLIGVVYWFATDNWQTRDAVKHLLSRPPTQQAPQGK